MLEIERKYLLDGPPDLPPDAERLEIEQGYLDERPGDADGVDGGRLRRVRRVDGSLEHLHTVKTGVGLVREERERRISAELFARHWPRTRGRRLRKTRWIVPAAPVVWMVDVFDDRDLVLAEVELPSPETAASPPAWLKARVVQEVTDDPGYTNAAIARRVGR